MPKGNITVTISPSGDTTIQVSGIKGKSCKDLTADLEKSLGVTTSDTLTREYHENATTQVTNKQ